MRTLLQILRRMPALGVRDAIRWRVGYRTLRVSYDDLYASIGGCVRFLEERRLGRGDRLILWGANSPEWVRVFWACVARGVQVVPLDVRSTEPFVQRIQEQVQAKVLVCEVPVANTDRAVGEYAAGIATFDEIARLPGDSSFEIEPCTPDDVVEIVYTSGTTGDPKGVVHRHRNISANLTPIAREIERLRLPLRVVGTLRILGMLPLSHMFGQALGLYVPVLLGGTSVFSDEMSPGAVFETIRRESVSAVAVVPRMLESLQHEAERRFGAEPDGRTPSPVSERRDPFVARMWRHRALHRALGWRFWFFIVGGAAVRAELERFWSARGLVVVQGYGLTETSPVVALNHPLRARHGSIGKPLPGVDVRIADDGEILVRGQSVVAEYWTRDGSEPVAATEGWLHTGDLGELDARGRLYYRGRKKDVIVIADGSNVHPQDVEAVLNAHPAVRDSAVVGVDADAGQSVHAALILDAGELDLDELIRAANARLEPHQRIRSWSVWPQADFPRTLSTAKLRRAEVARAVDAARQRSPHSADVGMTTAAGSPQSSTQALYTEIAAVAQRSVGELGPTLRLEDDLGLASLERVELLSALEHRLGIDLDEARFTEIEHVGELEAWISRETRAAHQEPAASSQRQPRATPQAFVDERVTDAAATSSADAAVSQAAAGCAGAGAAQHVERASTPLPRWRARGPSRLVRRAFQDGLLVPVFRAYYDLHVEGFENLEPLEAPVLFAANHTSHLDTPALLASLPPRWRRRVAPAMMSEYFRAYLRPADEPSSQRWLQALQFHLACALLNAFPLPQRMGGIRRVLRYMGEQVDRGACPLVFPEGGRSRDGALQPFKPGIGLMAVNLRIPVVPIHMTGLFDALPPGRRWPRRGRIRVRLGAALHFAPDADHRAAARRVEAAIRTLQASASRSHA